MIRCKGFGLIDLLIFVAAATILAAVAVPSAGSLRDGLAADRIVDLADEMARACHRYQLDTGRCASELSASTDGHSYTHPRHHELSMPQPHAGWHGPYLEAPLRQDESPLGGPVYLVTDLDLAPARGFALAGEEGLTGGSGQMLIFHGVPRRLAELVDARIDGKKAGGPWQAQGRVEWISEGQGSLCIFLMKFEQTRGDQR
ncbi:MAG: hypothetical protein H6807_09710 [Planctomycetes bacterium]|nr:hypothetical protein [Planctomycetota bacterium]